MTHPAASAIPTAHEILAPLSFPQEQLWLLQSVHPELTAYNLPRVFRLGGALDDGALERAFQAVIARHAVLRTRFADVEGEARQRVQDAAPFALERTDLRSLAPEARQAALDALVERTAAHAFDLGRAPLMMARLARLGEEEHVLAVCLHHIVSDGGSNPILARELAEAYALALRDAGPVRLGALALQYADHAAWQRAQAAQGAFARELDHWNRHLGKHVPALDLLTDHPRPARQRFEGAALYFDLPPVLAGGLERMCRAEKCTPFVLLFAMWQVLLSRYSGQDDFAVGVPSAGRQREEVQALLGFFVNTQVFRARLAPALSLRQVLRRVRADALAALEHSQLPFELLLASRAERRDPARNPLFQTMFGLQMGDPAQALRFGEVQVEPMAFGEKSAKFDLSLDVTVRPEGVRGRLEYSTALFERGTARRLADFYVALLETLVADPERLVGQLVLPGDAEREMLRGWEYNEARYEDARPVHELIERRVVLQPDEPAVVFGDVILSYAELNARANRLAHHLIAHGVRPDLPVGVLMERSVEMVVSLLAVMKAGGAYVPIDPEYPAERIAYMLQDSGVSLVLAQSHLALAASAQVL
ncbi:non-ribosomal peptide synthetase, partial [Variovorax sp. WS11]